MLHHTYRLVVVAALLLPVVFPAAGRAQDEPQSSPPKLDKQAPTKADPVEGAWAHFEGNHLYSNTMVFSFLRRPGGALVATIDYPESRRQQTFTSVAVKDGTVRVGEFLGLVPVFEAKVSADGKALAGRVKMGGDWRPLTLTRLDEQPKFRRPQEPVKPYPYHEEEVVFDNPRTGLRLAGTLTLPKDRQAPVPAVLLMSGSGADERNGLAGGHYPFLVLADYLTRRGVAVLRVDDRGVGKSQGVFSQATTDDLADDARAAVDFLRQRKDIDARRVGLIGHSDGGSGAGLLASRSPDIAFVVLLGAPGLPGDQITVQQTERGLKALGANEHRIRWNVDAQKRIMEAVRQSGTVAETDAAITKLVAAINAELTDADRERMGVGKAFQLNAVVGSSAWLRHFVSHDPRTTLQKVACPVLALNGDRDVLVNAKTNLPEIEKALRAGGNRDVTVKELANLNHFFQTCENGTPWEYPWIDETIAPAALQTVGDWIVERTGRGPAE